MTDQAHHPPPGPPDPPTPKILPAIQILSLLSFVGYAVLGMLRSVPLDRYVLFGILAFGIGIRPEAIGQALRGFTDKR